jgi:opacity protein-like surface antigen
MVSVKVASVVGAVALFVSAAPMIQRAHAADLPQLPPVYAPPIEEYVAAGWYLRGDIGITNQRLKKLDSNAAQQFPTTDHGLGFDSSGLFGLGVGYQFNNWFRMDVIGQYRSRANFHGSQTLTLGANDFNANNYSGSKSEALFLVNAYVDLGTWWSITPFIGAGVGGSYNMIHGFRDDGVRCCNPGLSNSVTYFEDKGTWNFAWAAHAGLAYKVNSNLTLELAYSYVSLGDARPGNFRAFDGSSSGASSIVMKDLTSHDVKFGVRWLLDAPVEKGPVMLPPLRSRG